MINLNIKNWKLRHCLITFGLAMFVGVILSFTQTAALGQSSDVTSCVYKPIHGVWYIGWENRSYANSAVDRDLNRIKNGLCANYISLQANVYQGDKYSNDPHIDVRTVDDEILASIVKKVHDLGMKVVLLTPLRPDDGTWEGAIEPTDLDSWFDHWKKILIHYAKFAEENGVEVLLLGSELPTLRGEPQQWEHIIRDIRQHYSGELSFSVNFWTQRSQFREVLNMTQWSHLDYIGITGYFELTPYGNPSVQRLKQAWTADLHGQNIIEDLRKLKEKYDKPIVFWEIGYQSRNETNTHPWDYLREGKKDEEEQRNCWIGFLQAIQDRSWIHGFMIFAEQVGLPEDKPGYHGYNVLKKKAQTVFCNICQ